MDDLQYRRLLDDCRSYLNTRYDLFRLSLLEKLSRILGLVLLALVVVLLLFAVLTFGALALVFVLAQWLPLWSSFLIIGAVYLLLMVLAVVFRRKWFINPIVGALSGILFSRGKHSENVTVRKEAQDD